MIATANGRHGYYRQGVGWRMLLNGLQFKLFGTGPDHVGGRRGRRLRQSRGPGRGADHPGLLRADRLSRPRHARPRRRYLRPDHHHRRGQAEIARLRAAALGRSRRYAARLAEPAVAIRDDMRAMIDGQRFFLRAFRTGPLAERIDARRHPRSRDLSDEALTAHCRRFVKTNYHPCGTCRMGAANDPMAVLDSRLRVRGIENLRVCDLSAMPNINAGNTNAPAMMLGSRCAEFILERHNGPLRDRTGTVRTGRLERRPFEVSEPDNAPRRWIAPPRARRRSHSTRSRPHRPAPGRLQRGWMKRNLFAGLLSAASDLSFNRAVLIGRCAGVAPEPSGCVTRRWRP